MVMVPTGHRIAHSPQRMQRVSSFSMAAPVTIPSSSAATSSSSTPKHSWLSRMCCTVSGSNCDAVERYQFQTLFRANIHATAAQNAHAAVFRRTFKNRVDPAVQAALRLRHRRWSVVSDLDFSHAGAALERKHRDRLTIDVEIIERHCMSLQEFYFDDRLRMFPAAQVFIDPDRRSFAVSDTINDEARSEDAIATRENSRRRSHQRLRIHCDQSARGEFDLVFRCEEVQAWRLADGHDDGVASNLGFAVFVECRIEALVLDQRPTWS